MNLTSPNPNNLIIMKNQIEKAIIETLVIDNKQSVHIAVEKIMDIVNDRWISVDEGLPEHTDTVLIFMQTPSGTGVTTGYYNDQSKRMNADRVLGYAHEITHWQPLPTAPKQKTQTT